MVRLNFRTIFSCLTLAWLCVLTLQNLAVAQQKEPVAKLTEHYELAEVRILFAKSGKDVVPLDDTDRNGTPDHVEDIAKQVWAARRLFHDTLGFPDPLQSKRYPGLKWIEVRIRSREYLKGLNGVAFDESQRSALPNDPPGTKALTFAVSTQVIPSKNITPAHETFHLVQYGCTYFKNSWFLEGMTRWSEHGLAKEGLGTVKYDPKGPWPQSANHQQLLFEMGPDSEFVLWNPIAKKTDRRGTLPVGKIPKELKSLKYSNGQPVLQDLELTGFDIMRDILVELGHRDDVAFKELGYESWTEANQTSDKNNPYIYQAVMDVVRKR